MIPGVDISIIGFEDVCLRVFFYYIVIFAGPREIGFPIKGVRAFLGLKKSPVNAVDIEVVIAAAGIRHAHVTLAIAGKNIAEHGVMPASIASFAFVRPGIILACPQVNLVEFAGALIAEQGEIQIRLTVHFAEKEPEGVLGIVRMAAPAAADAQAAIYLKSLAAIGIEQLDRCRSFPFQAAAKGVHVN